MWNKIKNFCGYLLAGRDRDRLKVEPRPLFDWLLLAAGTTILFFLLFGGYFGVRRQIGRLEYKFGEQTATNTPAFRRETLERVAREIQNRQSEFQALLENQPSLSDPAR